MSIRWLAPAAGLALAAIRMIGAQQPTTLRLHVSDSETKRWAQSHGWLQVYDNTARVLVEEAVEVDDLDAGALKEELSDAERRFSESDEDSAEQARALKDKQRAEAFLSIAQG